MKREEKEDQIDSYTKLLLRQIDRINRIPTFLGNMEAMTPEAISLHYVLVAESYYISVQQLVAMLSDKIKQETKDTADDIEEEVKKEISEILEREDDVIRANVIQGRIYLRAGRALFSRVMKDISEIGLLEAI